MEYRLSALASESIRLEIVWDGNWLRFKGTFFVLSLYRIGTVFLPWLIKKILRDVILVSMVIKKYGFRIQHCRCPDKETLVGKSTSGRLIKCTLYGNMRIQKTEVCHLRDRSTGMTLTLESWCMTSTVPVPKRITGMASVLCDLRMICWLFCLVEVRSSQKLGVVKNLEPGVILAERKSCLFSPDRDKIWWLFRENTFPQRNKAPDV